MMGDAAWGENHGDRVPLQRGRFVTDPPIALEIVVSRTRRLFEFLEPITLELKLTNKSGQPQFVNPAIPENFKIDVALIAQGRFSEAR